MQQVQSGFGLRCFSGNKAVNLCTNSKCPNNAVMCGDQQCQCHNPHFKCPGTTSLSKLKRVFSEKNQSLFPLFNLVYEALFKLSKLINIEMEELKKKIESGYLALTESEKRLYDLLVGNNHNDILPNIVSEAMSSLEKQPEYNLNQKIAEAQKQLGKKNGQLERMLDELKKLVGINLTASTHTVNNASIVPKNNNIAAQSSATKFLFSQTLKHKELTLINEKTITNKLDKQYCGVLLQPDILQLNSKICSVQFKINKTQNGLLMFGVCQLPSNFNMTDVDVYEKMEYGTFTSWNNVHLGNTEGDKQSSNSITDYRQYDIIEIEFERETKIAKVKNITEKTESVAQILIDSSLPLYFGVLLRSSNDQVQIIKSEVK